MVNWRLFPLPLSTMKNFSFLYVTWKYFSSRIIDRIMEIPFGSYHIGSGYPTRSAIKLVQDTHKLSWTLMNMLPSLVFLSVTHFRICSPCPDFSLGSNSMGSLHSGRGIIIRVHPLQKTRPSVAAILHPSPPFLGIWTCSASSSGIGKILCSNFPIRLSHPPEQFLCL